MDRQNYRRLYRLIGITTMKDRRQQLMHQVSGLPDKELLHILDTASSDYKFETIVYAKAVADKRGLSYPQPDMSRLNSLSTEKSKRDLFGIFRSHIFGIGFWVTVSLFVLANFVDYTRMLKNRCADCSMNYGFPYTYYVVGGWGGHWLHLSSLLWISPFHLVRDWLLAGYAGKCSDSKKTINLTYDSRAQ